MAIYVTGDPTDPSEDVFTYSINSNKLTGNFTSSVQPQGLGVKVLTTGSDNLKQRVTYIEYFDQSDSSKKLVIMSGQATHDTVFNFPVNLPDTDYIILLSQDTTDAGVSNRLVSTAYRIKTNASFTPFMYDTGETAVADDLAITFFVVWAVTSFDSDTLRISTDSEGHRRIEFHAEKDANDIHELISTWTYDEVPDSSTTSEHTITFPQGYPSTNYQPFATPILADNIFQLVSFTNVVERNVDSMKTVNVNKTSPTGNFYGFSWLVIEDSQAPDAETLSFTNRQNGALPNNDFLRALSPDSLEVYKMQKGSNTQGGVAPVGTPFETSGNTNVNFNLMHVATKNQTANPFVYNSAVPLSLSPMASTILFKNPASAFATIYDGTFFFDIHSINWRDTQTFIGTNTSLDITSAEFDTPERNFTGSLRYYESGSGDDIFVMQQIAIAVLEGTVTVSLPYTFPGGTTDYNIIVNNAAVEGNNVLITPIVVPGSLTETDFQLKVRNQQTGDAIDNTENRAVITIYWARSTAFVNDILEVVPVGDDRAVFFYGAEQEGRVAILQFGKSAGFGSVTFPEEQPSTDYSPATTAEGASNQLTSQVGANFAATMSFIVYDDEVTSADDLYWSTWYVRPV
jgi:hypothetical protein